MALSRPLPHLPLELVLAIVEAVNDVPTLNVMSRSCRTIHEYATPLLYSAGLNRDDSEIQSDCNIHTNYDTEDDPRCYAMKPYHTPIALCASAADPRHGIPVLMKVLALRPGHLQGTFHLPPHSCRSHWPWASNNEEQLSPGRTTVINVAATSGNYLTVRWLHKVSRNQNLLGLEVTASYACVCSSRHIKILQDRHGITNSEDCPDATPLHLALCHGHLEVARFMISNGANWSNFVDGCHGVTGLMIMVANGQLPLLEWLVDNGMLTERHVEHRDNAGLTVIDYLCACEDEKTANVMRRLLAKRSSSREDMARRCGSSMARWKTTPESTKVALLGS